MNDLPLLPPFACLHCIHAIGTWGVEERGRCAAFPDGIPDDIWFSETTHDKVIPGQVGDFVCVMDEPVPVFDDPEYGAPPRLDPHSSD